MIKTGFQFAKVAMLLLTILLATAAQAIEHGPGKGPWKHGIAEQHGFDSSLLKTVGDKVGEIGGRQGLVVVHQGVIIYEDYWSNPYHQASPEWRNASFSAAKSWGSALVGIAIKKGMLELDTLVNRLHPTEKSGLHPETKLRDILTMTSGGTLVIKPSSRRPTLKTENPVPGQGIDYIRVIKPDTRAPAGYGSSLRPGLTFYYDGEPVDHLANIIAAASGKTALVFSKEFLLEPLGVENFRYQAEGIDSDGNMRVAGSIELSVRDMARLGQLWLNGGRWAGEQLVDANFVAESIQPSPRNPNYGYLWWLNTNQARFASAPASMYFASGAFGQLIFVLPEQELVIATMGFQSTLDQTVPQKIWDVLSPIVK